MQPAARLKRGAEDPRGRPRALPCHEARSSRLTKLGKQQPRPVATDGKWHGSTTQQSPVSCTQTLRILQPHSQSPPPSRPAFRGHHECLSLHRQNFKITKKGIHENPLALPIAEEPAGFPSASPPAAGPEVPRVVEPSVNGDHGGLRPVVQTCGVDTAGPGGQRLPQQRPPGPDGKVRPL